MLARNVQWQEELPVRCPTTHFSQSHETWTYWEQNGTGLPHISPVHPCRLHSQTRTARWELPENACWQVFSGYCPCWESWPAGQSYAKSSWGVGWSCNGKSYIVASAKHGVSSTLCSASNSSTDASGIYESPHWWGYRYPTNLHVQTPYISPSTQETHLLTATRWLQPLALEEETPYRSIKRRNQKSKFRLYQIYDENQHHTSR